MIELSGLAKRWGARVLFEDVSLRVGAGEAVAIAGPSGSGKTTLLRCLVGLERADAGTVRVGDDVLAAGAPDADRDVLARVRRHVGFVFQQWNLFPHLSVLENVALAPALVAGRAPGDAERAARALLERVGIGARAGARPATLSGGEQQRAAIARALAMAPRALLMDEPTSALDPARVADLVTLLRGLCAEGLALLVVTHDEAFANAVAGRVVTLAHGKLDDGKRGASERGAAP